MVVGCIGVGMEAQTTTALGTELANTLSRCSGDAKIIEDTPNQIRITNIPHSATHMLPGGMSTLGVLGNHWNDWNIEYVENDDTVMYGSKSDKDVIVTRTA
jgi:hypothetical protein